MPDPKGNPCRSFVRVRPFTDEEASVCPADSPVPREVVVWDGKDTITVLDANDNFMPRRNGTCSPVNVLWSFSSEDPNAQHPVVSQKDVYAKVVAPEMGNIVEGYNTAFCIAGANFSGHHYTLYGEDVDGANRGLLPRFAEDVFEAFEKVRRDNSTLSCEVEVIDVVNENYVDLLANSNSSRSNKAGASEEALKLQPGAEGPRLRGATAVEAKNAADLRVILKQISKVVKKRNNTHTVSLRFTETFTFQDPENEDGSVKKSRRVHVLFTMLRNLPPAFQRCFDVAVEHDSGANPLAKVPTRETAFTKLFPSLFQQGFNLNMVSCVSPYYEHARETLQTLQFSIQSRKLKGKPKLVQDESLVEMRHLSDEVKDLKVAAKKQTVAIDVVQKELNAREVELMKQEAYYNRVADERANMERDVQLAQIAARINKLREKDDKVRRTKEIGAKRKELQETQSEKNGKLQARDDIMRAADDAKVRTETLEKQIASTKTRANASQKRMDALAQEERDIEVIETFNADTPEVQKQKIIEASELHKPAAAELKKHQQELKTLTSGDTTEKDIKAIQADYDKAYAAEAPSRDKAALEEEIKKLEKDIADMEADMKRMESEMAEKKAQSCCCTM